MLCIIVELHICQDMTYVHLPCAPVPSSDGDRLLLTVPLHLGFSSDLHSHIRTV